MAKKVTYKYYRLLKYWKILIPVLLLSGLFYFFILKDLPSPTKLATNNLSQSTQIYDRNGTLLYTIYGNRNQTFVPLTTIPKTVQEATIAIEDKDFYHHGAIDLRGILRAAYVTIFHKQVQGGSTITQQLVKNTLLSPEQTITRKIKEIILSFTVELIYPKDKILELYLNQIPYGGTAYGIEAASQTYFGKHAKDLDLAQSALLAGLPEEPSIFSPFGAHPELAKQRQTQVLQAMQDQGYISTKQEQAAENEKLTYKDISTNIQAPHFVLYIKSLLEQQYGEDKVESGGLKVTTSLDLSLQNMAQQVVHDQITSIASAYHVTNGAALVTDPATGEILAMVGSRNYFDTQIDGNVNVTLAHRQPGSSIKPINYALGLMHGYTAATPFIDEQKCFPNPGQAPYCPVNYDSKFHGIVQMRYALGNSFNIPAVKMLQVNGVQNMIDLARAMGITTFGSADQYGLSLTLGGGEVTMTDMAEAYGVFANGGYRVDLHPILEIRDSRGKILQKYTPPSSPIFGAKVLPDGVAYIISDILADNGARLADFGPNSALYIPGQYVPVKTGTTNDFRDNWTDGYTKNYVVIVWVGNNDNSRMSYIASGITGAAPIWHDIMVNLLKTKPSPPNSFPRPSDVISLKVCSTSGLLPPPDGSPNQCPTRFEYFINGTQPKQVDNLANQKVWVDKTTQQPGKPGQTDNLELKDETMFTDLTGDTFCLTCPVPTPSPTPTP